MSNIDYRALSDEDKIGVLQLMYQRVKDTASIKGKADKEIIIAETQIVYNRLKKRGN